MRLNIWLVMVLAAALGILGARWTVSARADSDQITRESNLYLKRAAAVQKLKSDVLDLENEELRGRIADMRGQRSGTFQIAKYRQMVMLDRIALETFDPDAPALNPRQTQARIERHNRLYPFDRIAPIGDLIR